MDVQLHNLPKSLKNTLGVFLIVISFGYLSGLDLLKHTTDFNPKGIEENVLGNEMDEYAEELQFKMSERQLNGIIHSHLITLECCLFYFQCFLYFLQSRNEVIFDD